MALLPGIETPSKTVTTLLREMFGVLTEEQQDHLVLISRSARSAANADDGENSRLALDWLVRTYTPLWLEVAGLDEQAAQLRQLDPIQDEASARAAGRSMRPVRQAAQRARRDTGILSNSQAWAVSTLTSDMSAAATTVHVAELYSAQLSTLADGYGALAAAEAAAGAYIASQMPAGMPRSSEETGAWAQALVSPVAQQANDSMLDLIETAMIRSESLAA